MSEDRLRRSIRGAVAMAIDDGLSNGVLFNTLIDNIAWVAVGGLPQREPLIELVEIIRHKLDLAVASARKELDNAQNRTR